MISSILWYTILIAIIVILSGGVYVYYKKFKKLYKEVKEFVVVAFNALQDKKLTIAEKEELLKELSDIKPVLKDIKDEFVGDTKELTDDIKQVYEDIKGKVKNK